MKNSIPGGRFSAILLWIASAVVIFSFLIWGKFCPVVYSVGMPWLGEMLLGISLFMLFYLMLNAVLAVFYRPAWKLSDCELPPCTIIVPAYNEGEHVAKTLRSLLESDFPAEKMQILAINDGSQDDTYAWILHAAERSNGRITPVNLIRNGGKKHALYRGIMMAKHEIIVTVDSDSLVERNAIRSIVSAFNHPEIGGVAGRIRVSNLSDGIIPQMMDIGFLFSFEILRSAQSLHGWVMCTPGALSAYRKSVITPFLKDWLNQRFLGLPAKIGEDRALTTMILRAGYRVTFERDALADTRVPHTYGKFCRMLLRWTRSDIRENLLILQYCFSRHDIPLFRWICFLLHTVAQIVNTVVPALITPILVGMIVFFPKDGLFWSLYSGISLGMISALVPALIYARRVSLLNAAWALFFSIYSVFALSWISLYAFFSLRNTSWLTRDLPGARSRNLFHEKNIEKIS
ncbi:MAG: glycosyltransferase [Lentisphaeria bacterium]|nr:glycosyltransferase [Lentisphaeria bacterium]